MEFRKFALNPQENYESFLWDIEVTFHIRKERYFFAVLYPWCTNFSLQFLWRYIFKAIKNLSSREGRLKIKIVSVIIVYTYIVKIISYRTYFNIRIITPVKLVLQFYITIPTSCYIFFVHCYIFIKE